jgi:hypothetical protein
MSIVVHPVGIRDEQRYYWNPLQQPFDPNEYDRVEYLISWDSGGWMPGIYDSEKAAQYAGEFSDDILQSLQDSVNPDGVITYEMLYELKAKVRK